MMFFLIVIAVLALAGYAMRTPESAFASKEEYERYFRTHIMGMK